MKDKVARESIIGIGRQLDWVVDTLAAMREEAEEFCKPREEWILADCPRCGKGHLRLRRTSYKKVEEVLAPECSHNHD